MRYEKEKIKEIWRVIVMRASAQGLIRHSKCFNTEEAAVSYADWVNDGRGFIITLTRFKQ